MTKTVFLTAAIFLQICFQLSSAQSRINFNKQQLFLNGSNIAWVKFAGDLGPAPLDTSGFRRVFDALSASGGNCMRLWLHTDGTQTPEFDADGMVVGPGRSAAEHLKKILDMAWERKIGLILCLWSFDMHRWSLDSVTLYRNTMLLTDLNHTRSYIDNALIPLVNGVKGHPAIVSWEIFNEAEGMTEEFGWYGIKLVPISSIQRFVNLAAGAIHRTDSTAQVTTGTWAMTVLTDVNLLPAQDDSIHRGDTLSEEEKVRIEQEFNAQHNVHMTAEEIISRLSAANLNYYRDDRLIAAGGDPDGTLDFYSNHYYAYQGIQLSPFHVPYSYWELTKPLVIAEFFPENILGLPFMDLYRILYQNGYAGALSWGWNHSTWRSNTLNLVKDIFSQYPHAIEIVFRSGTIIAFRSHPAVIEQGQSAKLFWTAAKGSSVMLDGMSVPESDSTAVVPSSTTTYRLQARGEVESMKETQVVVLPTGTIVFLKADPVLIGRGESGTLSWHTVEGSSATLNGTPVSSSGMQTVTLMRDSTFTLVAAGHVSDTGSVTIRTGDPSEVNRSILRPVVASSGDRGTPYEDPGFAVDGNVHTRWSSEYSDDQWIYVDLGKPFTIYRVVLRWESAYGKSYNIETSYDANNWTSVYTTAAGDGDIDDITGISGTGRYVRLRGIVRATAWGYSLWEFEVYGTPVVTGVGDGDRKAPASFRLGRNYPNPFNPSTTIEYDVPVDSDIRIELYNSLGQNIATLADGKHSSGYYFLKIDGSALASGIYVVSMKGLNFHQSEKIVLVK